MGLLDSLLGGMKGGGSNPLLDAVVAMASDPKHGGLGGLIDKFRESGLGEQADSWISTGKNLPISTGQLEGALGSGTLGALARQLGMDGGDLSSKLAELLPNVVDQLTPQGRLPEPGALGQILGALKERIG